MCGTTPSLDAQALPLHPPLAALHSTPHIPGLLPCPQITCPGGGRVRQHHPFARQLGVRLS